MSLDCIITIKGSGVKNQGHPSRPAEDRTGPISQFVTLHMQGVYSDVLKHVVGCSKCDPNEVLRGYLQGRLQDKFFHETSAGLVALAFRYVKRMPGRVKKETAHEFVWRCNSVQALCIHLEDPKEVALGLQTVWCKWERDRIGAPKSSHWMISPRAIGWYRTNLEEWSDSWPHQGVLLQLWQDFTRRKPFPIMEELEKILLIGSVMGI